MTCSEVSDVIHVRNLTKYYGDYAAVRDVSFDVTRGQIVGFLGPNGAGKSTTMRILTGYVTATSGQATIAGFDVFWQPLKVRQQVGYMAESCPLYPEMRVVEYLHFRGGVKGMHGRKCRQRIDYVLKRCWLADVSRQLIGTLSKGYRQRVGLADALLADPPVLILDEPTSGLDPAQIRETRQLIRELGKEHTILLSTHILPEVEMTCDRVIIIHRGQVVASSLLKDLANQVGQQSVLVAEFEGKVDPELVRKLPGVVQVTDVPTSLGTHLRITSDQAGDVPQRICGLAVECGWKVRELRPEKKSLEELFLTITEEEKPVGAK